MSKTTVQISDLNGLRDQVVKLRCLGHSFDSIAKTLNITYRRVKELIHSEFNERFKDREELKLQTAMQYDILIRPLLEKYLDDIDRRDAETIAKLLDNKARLLGLNEATKIDVRHVEAMSDEELEKELARHGVVKPIVHALPAADDQEQPELPYEDIQDAEIVNGEQPVSDGLCESSDGEEIRSG